MIENLKLEIININDKRYILNFIDFFWICLGRTIFLYTRCRTSLWDLVHNHHSLFRWKGCLKLLHIFQNVYNKCSYRSKLYLLSLNLQSTYIINFLKICHCNLRIVGIPYIYFVDGWLSVYRLIHPFPFWPASLQPVKEWWIYFFQLLGPFVSSLNIIIIQRQVGNFNLTVTIVLLYFANDYLRNRSFRIYSLLICIW